MSEKHSPIWSEVPNPNDVIGLLVFYDRGGKTQFALMNFLEGFQIGDIILSALPLTTNTIKRLEDGLHLLSDEQRFLLKDYLDKIPPESDAPPRYLITIPHAETNGLLTIIVDDWVRFFIDTRLPIFTIVPLEDDDKDLPFIHMKRFDTLTEDEKANCITITKEEKIAKDESQLFV